MSKKMKTWTKDYLRIVIIRQALSFIFVQTNTMLHGSKSFDYI